MDIEMPVPSRAITNAIQLGVNLLGWYGASFSDSPDDERLVVLVRVLLDNVGLENLRVPHEREARANFITNVALRLDFAGKKELSDAVRLGGGAGCVRRSDSGSRSHKFRSIDQTRGTCWHLGNEYSRTC